ncbi:hypothetical protein HNY73_010080 [Argiope bruennichi]|uniref:Uncharacterized protein n=1 Tax=Argiope bruennichi TaxID=94029 RepID=A0A8T0F4R2_ARGBR|nr:hypothetical protein HNY73_010080 [Argiope bruennichi]
MNDQRQAVTSQIRKKWAGEGCRQRMQRRRSHSRAHAHRRDNRRGIQISPKTSDPVRVLSMRTSPSLSHQCSIQERRAACGRYHPPFCLV